MNKVCPSERLMEEAAMTAKEIANKSSIAKVYQKAVSTAKEINFAWNNL